MLYSSWKSFVPTEACTHSPGRSTPMFRTGCYTTQLSRPHYELVRIWVTLIILKCKLISKILYRMVIIGSATSATSTWWLTRAKRTLSGHDRSPSWVLTLPGTVSEARRKDVLRCNFRRLQHRQHLARWRIYFCHNTLYCSITVLNWTSKTTKLFVERTKTT